MKKLLLAIGAAVGIYMIAKKLNAQKESGAIGNNSAADKIANGGIIANANYKTNDVNDESKIISDPSLPNENDDKEILEDGGNESGGTGGSINNSVGAEHL